MSDQPFDPDAEEPFLDGLDLPPDLPPSDRHEDDRLSAFLDDELDEDAALVVTRHLALCDRCLDELDALRMLRGTLRALPPVEPPADLYREVATKVRRSSGRSRLATRLTAAALASAALLGVGFLVSTDDESGTVSPPVDVYVVDHVARAGRGPLPVTVDVGR